MHEIVVGLGYGDEGKGTTASFLCSQGEKPEAVVRFSGGPQTLHNVILEDGTHHAFRQFGAGTLQNIATILSRFALVNPLPLAMEADILSTKMDYNPMGLMFVSENAKLITEIHREANRRREKARGSEAHGSCAHGIGETMAYATSTPEPDYPIVKDILNKGMLVSKIKQYYLWVNEQFEDFVFNVDDVADEIISTYEANPFNIVTDEHISDFIRNSKHLVFEGTQGVLLDEWHGFHPHTTWSTTYSKNAVTLLEEAGIPREDYKVIGVSRTYGTRHGFGPFPTELPDTEEQVTKFPEAHNAYGVWQGGWRAGWLDLTTLKYAIAVDGEIDELSLTHCDVSVDFLAETDISLNVTEEDCLDIMEEYTNKLSSEDLTYSLISVDSLDNLISEIEAATGLRVTVLSHGPKLNDKVLRD